MRPSSLSVAFAVTLIYSVFLILPAIATKAHPTRRVIKHGAKHIAAPKHIAAAHPAPVGAGQGGGVPDRTPEEMQELSDRLNTLDNSIALSKQGDVAIKGGNWAQAQTYYQQALEVWPDNSNALYGLGKCADAAGDTAGAIGYYRKVIYTNDPHRYGTVPHDGYGTNNVTQMMEFVLLLSKTGQQQEALAVYNRAAHLLNYRDADTNGGKPYLKVLLPEFGVDPNAAVYTPQRLQAMARVALSIEEGAFGSKDALPQAQEAVRLYPASPITYFYLGEQLKLRQKKGAKEAYEEAAALGDDRMGSAVQEELKIYH